VVLGALRRRGRVVQVQCELVATADGKSLVSPSGVLPLSEELQGDNGASFDNRDRPAGDPHDKAVGEHVDAQSQEAHPLLDPKFPFRVELWSITRKKRLDWAQVPVEDASGKKRIDLVVPARSGEEFEVRVENRAKHRVALTLLVDGINSLGQRRERLGNAWSWVLGPEKKSTIEGWYLPRAQGARPGDGKAFTLKRFKFVDLAASVAGRQKFGESIGVITAAFYAEYGRSLGVGEGRTEQRQLRTVDFKPGRLLGVVHIRYADEKELRD
jgi:hypothetical protein